MNGTRLLTALVQTSDLDYVEHFQALALANLELRRLGPSPERLVAKSVLEFNVGNYGASVAAAQDAVALAPLSSETHHQLGLSYLVLGLAKAGALSVGPGVSERIPESVTGLLWKSLESWKEAVRLAADDEETRHDLGILAGVLDLHRTDAELVAALRDAMDKKA
jgi:hypothetical protein